MGWAETIRALIAALDERGEYYVAQDPTLSEDVAAYVLDGIDPSVLQRLGSSQGYVLVADPPRPEQASLARDLYDAFAQVPHRVLVRWGRTIQAAGGRGSHSLAVDRVYWPGAILAHVGQSYPTGELPFDFFDFAGLLAAGEVHSGRLVVEAWRMGKDKYWRRSHPELTLTRLGRYGSAVEQLQQWLAPLLVEGDVDHRLHAFGLLAPVPDEALEKYAGPVAASAICGSAQVRDVAAPLVGRLGEAGVAQLRRLAVEAKPEQRRHALQLLWDLASDDEQRDLTRRSALADRATSVRTVAAGFTDEPRVVAVPLPDVSAPNPVHWAVAWTPELAETLAAYVAEARGWWSADRPGGNRDRYTDEEVLAIIREYLVSAEPVIAAQFHPNYQLTQSTAISAAIASGVLATPAMLKLLVAGDHLGDGYASYRDLRWAAGLLHAHQGLTPARPRRAP